MKTLIQKELKENLKVALLGLVGMTGLVVLNYRFCLVQVLTPSDPAFGLTYQDTQPLLAPGFQMNTLFFCAVFGVLLGWLQVHRERHRDLWAFLIHRPITRTQIFLGKTITGLGLYAVATGVPLLGLIIWCSIPGNVSAPFEWAMTLPALADFLTGIGYYFAGMLIGLRQARWYGSRALAIGVPVSVSFGVMQFPEFWQAGIAIVAGVLILATAAWGGWQAAGFYRFQPIPGKMALSVALLPGSLILAVFVGVAAMAFRARAIGAIERRTNYRMTKDGSILKVTQGGTVPLEVVDLNGLPARDAKGGSARERGDLQMMFPQAFGVQLNLPTAAQNRRHPFLITWYRSESRFFEKWRVVKGVLWFDSDRSGRLAGYDIATRQSVGSVGPAGFTLAPAMPQDRFSTEVSNEGSDRLRRKLAAGSSLYSVNLESRSINRLFSSDHDDPLLAATDVTLARSQEEDFTFVATSKFATLLTPDGKVLWQTPIEPAFPKYSILQLYCLEPSGQFALWICPSLDEGREAGRKLPIHAIWLSQAQGVVKQANLPPLPSAESGDDDFGAALAALLAPPPVVWIVEAMTKTRGNLGMPPGFVASNLVVGLLCALAGWWMGQRHRMSIGARLIWAPFILIGGIPGLLVFLSVQEWPALEKCSSCGKARPVDVEQCGHCHASFPPSETDGTEIFEKLGASLTRGV